MGIHKEILEFKRYILRALKPNKGGERKEGQQGRAKEWEFVPYP